MSIIKSCVNFFFIKFDFFEFASKKHFLSENLNKNIWKIRKCFLRFETFCKERKVLKFFTLKVISKKTIFKNLDVSSVCVIRKS